MAPALRHPTLEDRIIIHFDYDCFYASVIEAQEPALKSQPLAIQQKQIIVTCNYEARRRGLYKLQLITEAKRVCPDVIIVLGEDLTPFRNASKALYQFLRKYSWNGRVERLGFDEVWMDVTDIVAYNEDCLNRQDLGKAFFHTVKHDPTEGFAFDARSFAGYLYPQSGQRRIDVDADELKLRLLLGSHLAMHLRHKLEEDWGYTSTVGISTNRLLSKLVGNVHKPRGQTTLLPPYSFDPATQLQNNAQVFIDGHDIGAVPWIGFKSAQKLREAVLNRPADFHTGLVYGGSKEAVTVEMVRKLEGLAPEALEKMLAGPGQPKGIGAKVWGLLHGNDECEVAQAKNVPRQISIEDSYVRLDTMKQLSAELLSLSTRLIQRIRIDLTEDAETHEHPMDYSKETPKEWIGKPHTLRLTTRPRLPVGPDGLRPRTFKRVSRTGSMPPFVFNLGDNAEALAERLVSESLMFLFKKLHPEKSGWNLSLVNIAATDIVDTGTDSKTAVGRNIQSMFKNQEGVLREFQITEVGVEESHQQHLRPGGEESGDADGGTAAPHQDKETPETSSSSSPQGYMQSSIALFNDDEDQEDENISAANSIEDDIPGSQEFECPICAEFMPSFAAEAHERFHHDNG
ncbi:MAG: hypothetical protein Q9162_007167 [Coniocarpon cinnabarinum]